MSSVTVDPSPGPQQLRPRTATPTLYVDVGLVRRCYDELASALPGVHLHYAVKANPAPQVLTTLAARGCRWDVASPGEIDAVLDAGGRPADMSYGNTVKRSADIAYATGVGVSRFTFDSPMELEKLSLHAPGSTVMARITTSGAGADWALGSKFGCTAEEAAVLLLRAAERGHRVGIAFHVGSQQRDPSAWEEPLRHAARVRDHLAGRGTHLRVIDIGGGFPAATTTPTAALAEYGAAIGAAVTRHLGEDPPELMAEPGRALVADAGVLESEVLLVSERRGTRWVYLDAGVFTGLVETVQEAIHYRLEAVRDGVPLRGELADAAIAGPTCDSLDVLYASRLLPRDLRPGDRVRFLSAGAYTATYSTVGFNGFAPLRGCYR
jgi:ornithine decarboxylase